MTVPLVDELRARFRETSRQRIEEMDELLAVVTHDAGDAEAVRKLAKHFHAFAGMGGTYGYPRISELGDEAEEVLMPVTRSKACVSAEIVARLQVTLAEIRAALGAEGILPALPPLEAAPSSFDVLVAGDLDLATVLTQQGASVRVCATREDTLHAIATHVPDALVVDVTLPDGSGYDVVEALRATSEGHSSGAIVVSAGETFGDKMRAIRIGADAFEGKPLDVQALVRRVVSFRDRKRRPARRVLAVEDDPTQTFLIRSILGAAGYEVAICSDAEKFEEELTRFTPDLLLLDIHLANEDVSGYELAKYVRQDERFAAMPIIFVSGDSERSALMNATLSGADMHVSKPVDWPFLLSQIAARLDRAQALRDITERDALTGLLTRAAFEARARHRFDQRRSHDDRTAVLALIDIDHFKSINDTQGHAVGDRVLGTLGAILRGRLRQSDVIGRYGGDEIVLLLEDINAADAVRVVENLAREFSRTEPATLSAGVAVLETSLEATMSRADAALYAAKRGGRGRVVSI